MKKRIKPTVKSIILLVAILVAILMFGFVSYFFSSNAYHHEVFADYDNTTNLYPYNIIGMIGYEEVPGGMIAVGEDPQIIITPPDHAVEAIRVVFKNPLYGRKVQVYFAENHEPLSEENSVSAYFRDGDTEILIHIHEGTGAVFTSLRVDIDIFDQTFELCGIYAASFYTITTWVGNNEWWPLTIALIVLTIGLWFVYVLRRSPEGMFEKFKKIPVAFWVFIAVIAILFAYYHHRDVLTRAEQPFIIETIITGNIEYEDHLYYETVSESIDTSFIIGAYWFFAILMLIGLLLTVYLLYIKNISIEKAFLAVASIIGFTYLFLTFNSTPDASIHFQSSYAYSNVILGHPVHSARDIDPDPERWGNRWELPNHNWQAELSGYVQMHESLFEGAGDYEIVETGLWILRRENLAYIPSAIGIAAARLFSASTTMLYFAAALSGMIFFIAGTFLAIKIMPFGKMVLFCVALFPTTMNQAASFNPDNVMNVLAFLLIALVFYLADKVAKEEKIRVIEVISLCAVCAALSTMRGGVYLPLIGLLLLILIAKKRVFKLTNSHFLLCCGVIITVLIPLLVIHLRDHITGILSPHAVALDGTPTWGGSDLVLNPGEVWYLIVNTLVQTGDHHLLQAVGIGVGWPWHELPINHISIMFVFILLSLLSVQNILLTTRQRTITGIVASLSIASVYFAMLMAVTPYTADIIGGVQGRYFTPILPLVFLVFAGLPRLQLKHDISKGIITTLFSLQILVIVNYFVIIIWR